VGLKSLKSLNLTNGYPNKNNNNNNNNKVKSKPLELRSRVKTIHRPKITRPAKITTNFRPNFKHENGKKNYPRALRALRVYFLLFTRELVEL
jgi:hypothetical protein